MNLAALQNQLQAHVLDGEPAIERHLIGHSPQDVAARLAIYTDAYRARLTEALASNYPALAKLLGADDFGMLARRYIAANVSHRPSIRYYGHVLTGFVAADANYRDVPLLAELAAWEWAMTEVFDAADASALGVDELTGLLPTQWADLRFTLHPALRLLDLRWNVPPLWKALTSGEPRPAHELADGSQAWLLWRDGLQVLFRSLGAPEAAALRALIERQSFAELCEHLCSHVDEAEAPARAAAYLRGWMKAKLIVGIDSI